VLYVLYVPLAKSKNLCFSTYAIKLKQRALCSFNFAYNIAHHVSSFTTT
jgi:hypothetical protein